MSIPTPDETLLGLLADQPRHGYELLEPFHAPDQLGEVWRMSSSQLYAVLKRLEQQKFITGIQIPSENAPTRTEYTLTLAGKDCLMAWLYEKHPSPSIRRVRVEFLSRLYIMRRLRLTPDPVIQYQIMSCQQQLDELYRYRETLAPGTGQMAVSLVVTQLEAILQWMRNC